MPVYVFTGEEHYRLHQAVKHLQHQVVNPDMAALSYQHLQHPSWMDVTEAVGAVTFALGGDTMLAIESFNGLLKPTADATEDHLADQLKTLLAEVAPTRHVAFIAPKLDKKIRFPKWLCAQAWVKVADFKAIPSYKPDEAASVLLQEAKRLGLPLDRDAALLLIDGMGTDLQTLVNEVEKLFVYTNGHPITTTAVKAISTHNGNTFAMLDLWVAGKQPQTVLLILQEILLNESPLRLFGLIQTYVTTRLAFKLWQQLGLSPSAMIARSKQHPFIAEKTMVACKQLGLERLKTLKTACTTLEFKLKSGQITDQLALERLLAQ
jgi:DNA polymerase III subunit delta